ncbi:cysteine protease ATG4 NDAI_0F03770 [Naumovozyma dairenensis CBS 421]|uniref:Cysteine protease n=1 Tax=Naumovozyma dairenensis (strain ATCC 10597 / BCRC 20456 / CBS 421 / NBRC 0211 / NRRL Y-12639) TaxID=1071378 RepID=G0WD34_NAUDC|nr:hypothetical protein NDAI_0F03770 [Naumovozyma dairenensis CBS 421]CCD25695.1 hypothetical protein NDAI_0F03770 [Naumovozyma dairenensis CBS 421]
MSDIKSRLNFTYRTRFKPIQRMSDGPSPFHFSFILRENPINTLENVISNPDCFFTDIGWGCMIRTGQSLLGNALQLRNLGRDWRFDDNTDLKMTEKSNEIASWFMDTPEKPFSLHRFISKGMQLSGKKPGEWFGPAATARSIQSLVHEFPECGIDKCLISVSSGDIYKTEVEDVFNEGHTGEARNGQKDKTILILLGVKLGIETINRCYWDSIRRILSSEYSIGIAGGRPSSSLYFFGYQGDELLYFDPHSPQPSYDKNDLFYETCHTTNFGKLSLADMDPSMLLGIQITGRKEWEQWQKEIKESKIINILEMHPDDMNFDIDIDMNNKDEFDLETMCSNVSRTQDIDANTSVEGDDYVDVGALLQQVGGTPSSSKDDGFQDIQCKKQNIMVIGNACCSNTVGEIEVEKVLVEHDTIGVANPLPIFR